MAAAAAERRIPGWSRLVTARDAAERAVLRGVLSRAIENDNESRRKRDEWTQEAMAAAVQAGINRAFK